MANLKRLRAVLLLAGLSLSAPGLALADEEAAAHGAAQAAAQDADHGESTGGHEAVSLREIVAGHHALEFWGAVVNFGLLVFLVIRMAKKPTREFLLDRRGKIARGIEEAAEAKAKAEAIQLEYSERLKTLDQELNKLRSDIAGAAAQERARIVAEAEQGAQRVKAETEALVARQAEQLEAEIRREVVAAAIAAAERAVKEGATADDQRRLAESFARELGQVATSPIATTREKQA